MQQFLSCREMYVMIIVFSIVTVVVYIWRNREWDFAFEIAIFAGAVSGICSEKCLTLILFTLLLGAATFIFGTVLT